METFKDKFEKYELIFTPVILIILVVMIYYWLPVLVPISNYNEIFFLPSILGIIFGIVFTFLLDKYWKHIEKETTMDFLRLPTLVLILVASLSTLLVTYDPTLSFSILGFGLGALMSLICVTSFLTFYRSYYQ